MFQCVMVGMDVLPPPGMDQGVERFDADELTPILERFQASGLLQEGRVNLIGLDAIAARLADRWEGRREQIYDHVERSLGKHLEGDGYFHRVSATEYVVVQPGLGKFSAQISCLNYLRDVLEHFLGGAAPEAVDVMEVTGLSNGRITATKVDPGQAAAAAQNEPRIAPADAALSSSEDHWNPFVAGDGRMLRVSCVLEPVFELKTFSQIGFRIARRVMVLPSETVLNAQDLRNLTTADVERVDLATIARGVSRLRSESGNAKQPTLILPISYATLASQRSRTPLIARFKEASAGVEKGIVCEICDIDGVPSSALAAVISLVKPFCMILVGKLREAPVRAPDDLRNVGLHGIAFESGAHPLDHGEFLRWAEKSVSLARLVTRSVIIHGLPDPAYLALAGLAGASHASLRTRRDDSI